VATEDARFYRHFGLDPIGIARAVYQTIIPGGLRQGGSTITQQLAKISLLTLDRTISRKLQDMFYALLIERTYTKDEILELYLNSINLAHGNVGVEAAARYYFNKAAAQLNLEELDLAAVGRDVAELCRRAAEQKGLQLSFSAEEGLPLIRADEGLVRQAILNLIDNAVKYTEPGGRVHVAVGRDGEGVRLLVKDTGVGIPRDALTRVFERFYRVDKARSRREGGTGLGLSIVKHIVESHKGRLHIDSELGRGTTIGFTLPAE